MDSYTAPSTIAQNSPDETSIDQTLNNDRVPKERVIPVIKEDWQVHKELRETGTVRVQKSVREYEELVRDSLASEVMDVVRVPMDQVVVSPPPIRTEGDVTIISVVKEFPIIMKELRVVEEIRITRTRAQMGFEQPVLVRADEVTVERVPAGLPTTSDAEEPGVLTFVERREVAVVTKDARVVEEISLTTEATERNFTIKDTVRHTEVEVERFGEEVEQKTSGAAGS